MKVDICNIDIKANMYLNIPKFNCKVYTLRVCVCVWGGGGGANLSKDFCVPSEKGFTLNGKNLLPVGETSFLSE